MEPTSRPSDERFDRAGFEFRKSSPTELLGTVFATDPELLGGASSERRGRESDISALEIGARNIKPESVYEGIEAEGDEWMRLACEIARKSVEENGGPFGALILQVDDRSGRILRYWTGRNEVTLAVDPTAHAEVVAIRAACASLGTFRLDRIRQEESRLPQPGPTSHCVVYSSAEPCPMCYAAIRWARIRTIRFAATRFDAAVPGVDFSDDPLYREMALPYARRGLDIRQCSVGNSLEAFELWKRTDKIAY